MHPRNPKKDPNHHLLWKKVDKDVPNPYLRPSETQDAIIGASADTALENSGNAAYAALPLVTMMGIKMMCGTTGSIPLAPLGFPIAIGGIVIDTVKAPIALVVATEEAVRGGITKLVSLIFERNPTKMAIDRIFQSFLMRMREAATLLVVLGLEDKSVLNTKLASGDIEELVGLTLLLTAYASRDTYIRGESGDLLLANGKRLSRKDCPLEGLPLFDKVSGLRDSIYAALELAGLGWKSSTDERKIEESRIVCQWIHMIRAGNAVTVADRPDASPEQIAIVNSIISQIKELSLFGIDSLPTSKGEVARQMSKI